MDNIPGYEGYYKIDKDGNVDSIDRLVTGVNGKTQSLKGRVLKTSSSGKSGYKKVELSINGTKKTFKVHQLVAITYLGHRPGVDGLHVDHINGDKLDNKLTNLQLTTNRWNSSKDKKGGTSKYVGVYYLKKENKWGSSIYIEGNRLWLGTFNTELEAHETYQNKLNQLK